MRKTASQYSRWLSVAMGVMAEGFSQISASYFKAYFASIDLKTIAEYNSRNINLTNAKICQNERPKFSS